MRRSLLLSIALTLAVASPALAKVKWFHSPSGNISCEVSSGGGGYGANAFCQSIQKPRSVTLSKQGTLEVCHGTKCLGDGPETAFELGYGKSVEVGNFKCTSKKTGMRCSGSPSGRGFERSRDALDRLELLAKNGRALPQQRSEASFAWTSRRSFAQRGFVLLQRGRSGLPVLFRPTGAPARQRRGGMTSTKTSSEACALPCAGAPSIC